MIKKKIMTSYPFLRSINSIQMQKLIPCLKYYVDYIDVVIVIVFILVFLLIFVFPEEKCKEKNERRFCKLSKIYELHIQPII